MSVPLQKILWASMNIGGVQIIHLRHYKYIYAYPGGLFQPSSAKVVKTALQVAWRLESSETWMPAQDLKSPHIAAINDT